MRRLAPLLLIVLAAACGGGGGRAVSANDLGSLVLRPGDVGAGFASFYDGPTTHIDVEGTLRADPARFGREGGWIARYHRGGGPTTRGPLVVESRVDVFKSAGGARNDLGQYRDAMARAAGAERRRLSPPRIGDEAAGVTFVQPSAQPIRFYELAWRDRNATASVLVEGFDGQIRPADAFRLARKQERRLASA